MSAFEKTDCGRAQLLGIDENVPDLIRNGSFMSAYFSGKLSIYSPNIYAFHCM